MTTTIYTNAYNNFRTRIDYDYVETDVNVTVSGTVYLQHKGSAITSSDYTYYGSCAVYKQELTAQDWVNDTSGVKTVASHSDWTNVASRAFSKTISKSDSASDVSIACGVSWSGRGLEDTSVIKTSLVATISEIYYPPTLTLGQPDRCLSDGTLDDEGTYVYCPFTWSVHNTATNALDSVTVTVNGATATYTNSTDLSGSGSVVVNANIDTEHAYTLTATITDTDKGSARAVTQKANVPTAYYPLDVLAGGHGVAIGGPALTTGFTEYMPAYFTDNVFMVKMAGIIQMFAGAIPPTGWLVCDGSEVSRTDYPELFEALGNGTIWGAGDGSTTFNLPDLRGRAPIGAGTGSGLSTRALGGKVGAETHTLTAAQIPAHSHAFPYPAFGGDSGRLHYETGGSLSGSGSKYAYIDGSSTNRYPAATNNNTGGGGAHNNMQPSAVVNFIICTGKTSQA